MMTIGVVHLLRHFTSGIGMLLLRLLHLVTTAGVAILPQFRSLIAGTRALLFPRPLATTDTTGGLLSVTRHLTRLALPLAGVVVLRHQGTTTGDNLLGKSHLAQQAPPILTGTTTGSTRIIAADLPLLLATRLVILAQPVLNLLLVTGMCRMIALTRMTLRLCTLGDALSALFLCALLLPMTPTRMAILATHRLLVAGTIHLHHLVPVETSIRLLTDDNRRFLEL